MKINWQAAGSRFFPISLQVSSTRAERGAMGGTLTVYRCPAKNTGGERLEKSLYKVKGSEQTFQIGSALRITHSLPRACTAYDISDIYQRRIAPYQLPISSLFTVFTFNVAVSGLFRVLTSIVPLPFRKYLRYLRCRTHSGGQEPAASLSLTPNMALGETQVFKFRISRR